jgi:hypothetical protein
MSSRIRGDSAAAPQATRLPARLLVLLAGLLAMASPASAQRGFGGGGFRGGDAPKVYLEVNVPYDGSFEFSRIRYSAVGSGFRRDPMWSHDYARAEANFTKILKELSTVRTRTKASAVYGFDDPLLFEHNIAYLVEVGHWVPTEAEVAGLRRWLQRGGFLIVDDFRDTDIVNFEEQMKRVLPDATLLPVPHTHPIWDSFYHFTDFEGVRHPYGGMQTQFWGIFERNDPTARLMVIASYNGDIAEYWEFADEGLFPLPLSNESFKVGINYILYGLTR